MSLDETWLIKNPNDLLKVITECCCAGLKCIKLDNQHLSVSGTQELLDSINKNTVEHVIKNQHETHNYIKMQSDDINHNDLNPNINSYYTALQLASIYNFPAGDGLGQKIGIISLGGGYNMSDVTTYLSNLGITTTPNITNVSVNGAVNNPADTSGANLEVILDLEIIVAIAPKAAIRMYFAPNTFTGFYNAINAAINDQCNIVSISWGLYESGYGSSNLTAYNNLFNTGANQGVTFCIAAGDGGSSDNSTGNNVDFPASSPYVVGCGGTTLNASNNIRISEVVWNNNPTSSATGGGISKFFSKPTYQNNVTYPLTKRGVSDISGNADPYTGYRIYYNNSYMTIGGTSATAPLMAGLFARINQVANTNVGFVNPVLYNNNIYYDIVNGNNGSYTANTNWDPCSGLGVINGQQLLNLFLTPSITPVSSFTYTISNLSVVFVNTSTNATSYLWDFGDSQTSTLVNPDHTFSPGSYTITLTATNGSSNNSIANIIINGTVSNFTASPITGITPLTVQFVNSSINASTYAWQFGDGQTSSLTNPSHTYNAGIYSVSLTADSDIKTRNNYITVSNGLQSNFTSFVSAPKKRTVQFTNTSTGLPTTYLWNFGNNMKSIFKNPSINYNRSGTYNVTLTVYKNGTSSTITKQVIV
jgi:subtilase family serine protease